MEETKINGLKITFTQDFLTIQNSYQISDIKKMKKILEEALSKTILYNTNRSMKSLIREWIGHNILYKMHLFRSHTRDSDFEKIIKKRISLVYFILSFPIEIKEKILKIFYFYKKIFKTFQYRRYLKNHSKNIWKAYKELIKKPNIFLLIDKEILDKLYKRILIHDKSKYSKEEFEPYRKNFYPINKREKEENIEDFKKAWEHHWKNNSHHWEYRQNKQSFNILNDEEVLDVLENVIDWLAMGYNFKNRPYEYYEKNKDEIILCKQERIFLENIIYNILENKEN